MSHLEKMIVAFAGVTRLQTFLFQIDFLYALALGEGRFCELFFKSEKATQATRLINSEKDRYLSSGKYENHVYRCLKYDHDLDILLIRRVKHPLNP